MDKLENLILDPFAKQVFEDGSKLIKKYGVKARAVGWPAEIELDESEFYVQKLGFHLAHCLTWCKQLDLAIELLSNYDYAKKSNTSRADHLIYNVENFLIRLNSVYDRTLQLMNATFHLCLSDEHVGHDVVVKNYKVAHRPEVQKLLKRVRKYLSEHAQDRHTLIHKHSLMDPALQRIEMLYMEGMHDRVAGIKAVRAKYLRDFLAGKKREYAKINSDLYSLLSELFGLLLKEYVRQKKQLRWSY